MRAAPRLIAVTALVLCVAAIARPAGSHSASGDATAPAPGDQTEVALAFDGANYLVVWQDTRSGNSDIYGARVSPSGNVLDPGGFPISTAPDEQGVPAVAFDGTNYLVVWPDPPAGLQEQDIYGARVTPSGTVLDSHEIPISTYDRHQGSPAVAFDGANYLVVWPDPATRSSPISTGRG